MADKSSHAYLGIDLGGTAMKGSLVHTDGSIGAMHSMRTPIELGRTGILQALVELIAHMFELSGEWNVTGIGIGSAGRIDTKSGTVLYATDNLPGWTGTEIAKEIEQRFPYPVVVDNDVNVAAVGECWIGAAVEEKSVAFMALGTGVGGALVVDGALIQGHQGGAGDLGHQIINPGGMSCNCGQRGCLEQYASGTALNRESRAIASDWDSRRLVEAYMQGDVRAQEVMKRFTAHLAVGLINVQRMFDPDLIVLGGGLIEARHSWWDSLLLAIAEHTSLNLRIEPALLGNRAGMIGAARLAMLAGKV
ncbi:N-acetyl-D-glucosamine kinase [compost metagenome]